MVKLLPTKRIRCYTLSGQSNNFSKLEIQIRSLLEQQSQFISFQSSPIDYLLNASKSINLLLQVIKIIKKAEKDKGTLQNEFYLSVELSENHYTALFSCLNTNGLSLRNFSISISRSN